MHNLLLTALLIFVYMTGGFFLAQIKKRNDIVDVLWGIGFVLVAWMNMFIFGELTPVGVLVASLVTFWGLRLSLHIGLRHRKATTEDYRYATWRKSWLEKGKRYFYTRTFLQIFMLQGVFMFIISAPIVFIAQYGNADSISVVSLVGIILWSIGFFFEAVGDAELQKFVSDPKNHGRIMKYGLWKYTRHPNYFGEIVQWWGIFVLVLPYMFPLSLVLILSPLTITFLLLFVSGIPMLEKKWDDNEEFQMYKQTTSPLVPLPPQIFKRIRY
jgi:steroid 5-alpha reductase family enzyme